MKNCLLLFVLLTSSVKRMSGLVKKDGENVLRRVPGTLRSPEITCKQTMAIPDLNLVWTE